MLKPRKEIRDPRIIGGPRVKKPRIYPSRVDARVYFLETRHRAYVGSGSFSILINKRRKRRDYGAVREAQQRDPRPATRAYTISSKLFFGLELGRDSGTRVGSNS